MSDPFADLLTQFKQNDKESKDLKPNISRSTPPSSTDTEPRTAQLKQKTPSTSAPYTTSENTEIDDDFVKLFGSTSISSEPRAGENITRDEFDTAFDLLQTSSRRTNCGTSPNAKPLSGAIPVPVVDEVRDMEIAKLVSLGFSIDRANASYDKGILYENLIEERKRTMEQRRRKERQMAQTNWEREESDFPDETTRESSVDLFSLATGLFNKGKKLVDQFTIFPEESDQVKEDQVLKPRQKSRRNPLPKPESSLPQRRENVSFPNELSQKQPVEIDLLNDVGEKLILDEKQIPSPAPSTPINIRNQGILLDFDEDPKEIKAKVVSPLPVVPISEIELSGYNEFKDHATEFFKNGDYVAALEEYEKSANTLPHAHPLRIISYSNLIASHLKTGEYKECIRASEVALSFFPEDMTQWTQIIQNSQPPRTYRDMWPKIALRRAEAFEHSENYKEAFNAYQVLVEKNFCTDKVLEGKRRCQKVLRPEKCRVMKKSPSSSVTPQQTSKHYENLERVQDNNRKLIQIEAQKHELYDKVHEQIEAWKSGKPEDIRHLLSNLQTLLTWCDWKPVSSAELVMPRKVKLTYMKAVAKTHPDKIPDTLPLEQKMLAESIFSCLSSAWEKFKTENDIS
ncbi:SWA2 (YDR320C) [Zygosaccharomyces parabailii]|nr:SWA2 (YDR320C) [Zygosaccharomyces parabailii]CDH12564.1 related to Auxilin-like clathrin uncoating factor SWA2 [Zygosaccharomyces bailii ISA1307]